MHLISGIFSFLLLRVVASSQTNENFECVPKFNEGGQLNWELGEGESDSKFLTCSSGKLVRLRTIYISVYYEGTFRVRDGANSGDPLLAEVTQYDHSYTEPSILQDIVSSGSIMRLDYDATSPTSSAPSLDFLWTCMVPGGTTVVDYYSSGVELNSVITSDHVTQTFVARHTKSFLLGINLGALGFTGKLRILKGGVGDQCSTRELLAEQNIVTKSGQGASKDPPYDEDIVPGSPSITRGFNGAYLQLVRLHQPVFLAGGETYVLELVPDDFTNFHASFGTSVSGDDAIENIFHHNEVPTKVLQFDLLNLAVGLENRGVTFEMTSSGTAYLDTDSLLNQPSLSIHAGTSASLLVSSPTLEIQNIGTVKGNTIASASFQPEGTLYVLEVVASANAGIDCIELYGIDGSLLALLTVYSTIPISLPASVQYITEGLWSNPTDFFDSWDHNPQSAIDTIGSQVEMFTPLGISFDVTNNGLVVIEGTDADGDGTLSDRSEWTEVPFLAPPEETSYPADSADYFVNIYAVRQYNDTSRTGSTGGGGGTSFIRPPGQGGAGAFVKTYKNKPAEKLASTLMHEVGHCLGLAHHKEYSNFPALALRSTKRNQNLMAVGRTNDDNLSPRQWLTIRETARMYSVGDEKSVIDTSECDCTIPYPCTPENSCVGSGNIDDYNDPVSAFDKCSTWGICLGGKQYNSNDDINNAVFGEPLCSVPPLSPQPNICSYSSSGPTPPTPVTPEPTLLPTTGPVTNPTPAPTTSHDNDNVCSKYPGDGWHTGYYIQSLSTDESPNGLEWKWQECAEACAIHETCEFWTLRLESNKACLLMKDQGSYQDEGGHIEGPKDPDCLEPPVTSPPTPIPTSTPTKLPTPSPTNPPTLTSSLLPTDQPSPSPTQTPSLHPTIVPTSFPTLLPTAAPTSTPTLSPTVVTDGNNDGVCSKYPGDGWHSGYYLKSLSTFESPNGVQWTWEECAHKCAAHETCEFWTLRLEGNKACLLMTDQGTYQNEGNHVEGPKDLDCLNVVLPTTSPTPSPTDKPATPSPTIYDGPCQDSRVDVHGWYDSDGERYDCNWYSTGDNCQRFGDSYDNFGYTANEACDACGGGLDWHDSDGPQYDCSWYSVDTRCLSYGNSYENFGLVANQACCACK